MLLKMKNLEMGEPVELLFFDTFSHETSEELNLDLVQFPKPVFVREVRIIPLGARVQADFPGGVRLGATNPSQFSIEFFVNDLGKPGASTFESLGGFEYNQNGCIHLECTNNDVNVRQIPTDGLVLRGWYTTITLAVYGTMTKNIAEQVLPTTVNTPITQPTTLVADVQQIVSANPIETNWQQDVNIATVPLEYNQPVQVNYSSNYVQPEPYAQDYHHMDYYNNEPPKDPRYHTPETDWEQKSRQKENPRPRDAEPARDLEARDPDRHYSRSHSRDKDRREYRETSRDRERDRDRDWERGPQAGEYRDREKEWDRSYKHPDNYKRSRDNYGATGIPQERDESRKRPRTPPILSPRRPHTPHGEKDLSPGDVESISEDEIASGNNDKNDKTNDSTLVINQPESKQSTAEQKKAGAANELNDNMEEAAQMDLEQFEPILSDEDICDESENYHEVDYDFTTYSNNDDVIKLFNPLTISLQKYDYCPYDSLKKAVTAFKNQEEVVEKLDNYFKKYSAGISHLISLLKPHFNRYATSEFKNFSPEIKEEYVHICEQLPALLDNQYLNFIALVSSIADKLPNQSKILNTNSDDIKSVYNTLLNFVNIGLDFELAFSQNQPGYKIRHIKCGARLVESIGANEDFMNVLVEKDVHKKLLSLFDKEYMALSIKLLILRALACTLAHGKSIEYFSTKTIIDKNGYQMLLDIMKNASSVRIKFAVNSLLTKLNLNEVLKNFKKTVFVVCNNEKTNDKNEHNSQIPHDALSFIIQGLNQILKLYRNDSFDMSQPKRFLPVSDQFEINRCRERNCINNFFSMHQILECLVLLLTHPATCQYTVIITIVHEFISELLKRTDGIRFLSENMQCTSLIMKCFLQPEDVEAQYILSESAYIKSQSLGLNIAYTMQVLYHIECLLDIGTKNNFDCDANDVLDQLHEFYSLTYVNVGKLACAHVLSLDDNILCLLQFLIRIVTEHSAKDYLIVKLKKSAGFGYIIDLLSMTIVYSSHVPFLEKYGKQILEIVKESDMFDVATAAKLNEVISYLKPLEIMNPFSYDDIKPLCEILKQTLASVTSFPGQLITSLRILKYLGIPSNNNQCFILSENSNYNLNELKYKYVILQLFSLDGVSDLVTILQKICEYYEQPSLHVTTFSSFQGCLIMNIVLPCVQLLRQMLMHVIHCRNTNFRDLTAVPVLLQVFNIAHSFPQSALTCSQAQKVCKEIIDTLLVYSQPVSDEVSENDSLNKILWTLMCGEVIKYITLAPHTFIPGLLIFSELLPLPLPFQTRAPLTSVEIKRAINLRKLWSAHLHSHSTSIQELINRLCTSVHQPLLHLLRRVCIQLSDLAANTAIMIARGVLDTIHAALAPITEKAQVCNGHTARLLHFLACLTTHGALKCATLQLLWSHANALKIDEKYPPLVNIFCQILKMPSTLNSHIQAQECIINIIQNLCDAEINLIQNSDGVKTENSSDFYLSNSLPPKDMLLVFVSTLVEHLSGDNTFVTVVPIMRTFILLTDHDYGFYHLCACFERKPGCFLSVLKKINNAFSKDNTELLQIFNTILEFIRIVCDNLELESSLLFTPRTLKMNAKELNSLVGWTTTGENKHPLFTLEKLLKENFTNEDVLDNMFENMSRLMKLLSSSTEDGNSDVLPTGANATLPTVTTSPEPQLPNPDTLLAQFASRPVYTLTDVTEEQLTTSYWLSVPTDEGAGETDHVPCDLAEICRQHLPAEMNITREVEKYLRVYPSQEAIRLQSEQLKTKRTTGDDMKNDKQKKPYITPMRGRGFPRIVQQRGDVFRSRPPNTSRPPSLHVDDFVALETCGAQPTGPTGYNKLSRDLLNTRVVRNVRGRTFISPDRGLHFRPL